MSTEASGQEELNEYATCASEFALENAKKKGWDVVIPGTDELFIDIDNDADLKKFYELFEVFVQFRCDAVVTRATPSPSGKPGHFHIVVDTCGYVTPEERVLLQAALGSDRKRELLAWARISKGDKIPTLFYEEKKKS